MARGNCKNHPKRKEHARKLCSMCYMQAFRKGLPPKEPQGFVHDLIDELEIRGGTWPVLVEKYGTNVANLSAALKRQDRQDLIEKVQYFTYGVVGRPAITSVRMSGKR